MVGADFRKLIHYLKSCIEYSVKLVSEFQSIQNGNPIDYDSNNLIYGSNFVISDYCSDKSKSLWNIENTGVGILVLNHPNNPEPKEKANVINAR